MVRIPIKIKKNKQDADKVADELKVDLRNGLARQSKQSSKKWLFLSVALIIIVVFLSWSSWSFYSQKMPFADLVPKEALVFGIFDQAALYRDASVLERFLKNGQQAVIQIDSYLSQAQLDFKEDVEPLFEKQVAFVVLLADSETSSPWLLFFKKRVSLDGLDDILSQIEPSFKNNYNFSSQIHRQVKMTVLEPISSSSDTYAYAQIEDYLIIGNSQEYLKKIIDSVIDNH
jgi:hypothetical protein